MHRNISLITFCLILPVVLGLSACGGKKTNSSDGSPIDEPLSMEMVTEDSGGASDLDSIDSAPTGERAGRTSPQQLPVRYQQPTYIAEQTDETMTESKERYAIKVGANISSTKGPSPYGT